MELRLDAAIGQIADNLFTVFKVTINNVQYFTNAGGNLLNSAGQAVASTTQAVAVAPGVALPPGAKPPWNAGLNNSGIYLNAVGSFLGSYLASKLVQFDTIGGQIGASLGSAVGGIYVAGVGAILSGGTATSFQALALNLGSFAGPVGAFIGAFIGYILGGLIGTASKDAITGTAAADTLTVNGAAIALTAAHTLNGVAATAGAHTIRVAALIDGGAGDETAPSVEPDRISVDPPISVFTARANHGAGLIWDNKGQGRAARVFVRQLDPRRETHGNGYAFHRQIEFSNFGRKRW